MMPFNTLVGWLISKIPRWFTPIGDSKNWFQSFRAMANSLMQVSPSSISIIWNAINEKLYDYLMNPKHTVQLHNHQKDWQIWWVIVAVSSVISMAKWSSIGIFLCRVYCD